MNEAAEAAPGFVWRLKDTSFPRYRSAACGNLIGEMLHLAQYNIARARAPLGDPLLADFVAAIARVNEAAEAAPGFVWRLKDEDGASSSYVHAYDDERMLVNLTLWESVEALRAYTYSMPHVDIFRRRVEWFEPPAGPSLVLWWIEAGHIPSLDEADARLRHLASHGPSDYAFTFKTATRSYKAD